MFAQVHFPQVLEPNQLDEYLSKGWFRMEQTIFITHFLNLKGKLYSTIWLRVALQSFDIETEQKKIVKINSNFSTEIQKVVISQEKEELFQKYAKSVSFEASPSLTHFLQGDSITNIYNTYEINVYDVDRLIATGFFDLGSNSVAGILCFYDPEYKKYSLGKYLMYHKMVFAKRKGFQYFYPGYFVPGYPTFDYKLKLSKTSLEYYSLDTLHWMPISHYEASQNPLLIMQTKLLELQEALALAQVDCALYTYEYHAGNLVPHFNGYGLLDFPVFLFGPNFKRKNKKCMVVVYDVRDELYHLLLCKSTWKSPEICMDENHFASDLLQSLQDLVATDVVDHMVEIISCELQLND